MNPAQGEVWSCDLAPVEGGEPGGVRQAIVISSDDFNSSPFNLVVIVPIERDASPNPMRVALADAQGNPTGFVACPEHVRSISVSRLVGSHPHSKVDSAALKLVIKRALSILGIIL